MGIYVNTNLMAINAYQNLEANQSMMQDSLQKLSSGYRINKAADDAAGLVISEELRSQVNGYQQATSNAQSGINLVQTAEGALNETAAILQRIHTLTVQAANGTTDATGLSAIQAEVTKSLAEIDQINTSTQYGSTGLFGKTFTFQVGNGATDTIAVTTNSASSAAVFGGTALAPATAYASTGAANTALASIDTAINTVSTWRANLGAVQNQLQHAVNNLTVGVQNLSASESSIRDTDMASQMVEFTKQQILVQAGVSMLAQANQTPQAILKLLG